VLAGRREILELGGLRHSRKRTFLMSQTHGSETTGLAATLATMQECQRLDVTGHIWSMGKKLVDGFRQLAAEEDIADHVRIIGFDCNPQILCTHADGTYYPDLQTSFHEELISWGILIPWITITIAHTDAHLETTFHAFREGMKKVKRALEEGNVAESFVGEAIKPVFRAYN
jgi:glutamate-1-semialdehyde 2,1-aminomutase